MNKAVCEKLKTEIKNREGALEKQCKKQVNLDKLIIKDSGNRARINQCQIELADATLQIKNTTNLLVDSVDKFEIMKRKDVRVRTQRTTLVNKFCFLD